MPVSSILERRGTVIVNRRTFHLKPDRIGDAVALAKKEGEQFPAKHNGRSYLSSVARWHVLAWEAEFESLAEYERVMAEWFARPEAEAALATYRECFTGGGTNEIWELL
jgi:hypothetical protein